MLFCWNNTHCFSQGNCSRNLIWSLIFSFRQLRKVWLDWSDFLNATWRVLTCLEDCTVTSSEPWLINSPTKLLIGTGIEVIYFTWQAQTERSPIELSHRQLGCNVVIPLNHFWLRRFPAVKLHARRASPAIRPISYWVRENGGKTPNPKVNHHLLHEQKQFWGYTSHVHTAPWEIWHALNVLGIGAHCAVLRTCFFVSQELLCEDICDIVKTWWIANLGE